MSLLWVKCWCPLLQGIARLCCDIRKEIRMSALTILQRSLLAHDLQSLTATEWESCFNKVLFPMLARLLEVSSDVDPVGLEETRMRAATLLCKAFLQRLNTLLTLSTFTALWMTILDFMDKYMHADNSDLLYEAIPESMKNMLLVMSTAGVFEHDDPSLQVAAHIALPPHQRPGSAERHYSALWQVTWERIDCFLPNLKQDLLATKSPWHSRAASPPVATAPEPQTMETEGRPLSDDESTKAGSTSAKEESVPRSDSADELASEEKSPNQSKPSLATLPQSSSFVLQPPLPALNPPKKPGINLSNTESQTAIPIILAPIPPLGNELKGLSKENISVKRETAERPDSLPLSLSSTELTGGVPEDVSDSDDRSPMLDNDSNRSPSPMDSSRKMPQGPNNVYDI